MIKIGETAYVTSLLVVWGRKSLCGEWFPSGQISMELIPSWRESLGGAGNHGDWLGNADSKPEGVVGTVWQRGQLGIVYCWGFLQCFFFCFYLFLNLFLFILFSHCHFQQIVLILIHDLLCLQFSSPSH